MVSKMLVLSRGNFLIRANDGTSCLIKKDVLANIPDWVATQPFFQALCREGRIVVTETTKDKDVEKAVAVADEAQKKAVAKSEAVQKKKKTTKKAAE